MATGAVTGRAMTLTLGGSVLAGARQVKINFSRAAIDASSADSMVAYYKEFLPGLKEWSVDVNSLYIYNNVAKKVLQNYMLNTTEPAADISMIVTMPDNNTYTGSVIVSSLDFTGPYADVLVATCKLTGTGILTASVS